MVKIVEITGKPTVQSVMPEPTVVSQQARVGKVMQQIAASNAQLPPTEIDKVLAMRRMSQLRKKADTDYAERLRQQLAAAQSQLQISK